MNIVEASTEARDEAINSLFVPFKYKTLELRNRIVMSPMTRYFSPDGVPGEDVEEYYRRRADGEVGLIISEGAFIDRPTARNVETVPSFAGDALPAWGRIGRAVSESGARMIPQLWHVGGHRDFNYPNSSCGDELESPSGLIGPDASGGRTMTADDVDDVIAGFTSAALDAQRLGFAGVELHGGHGYLFDQFFWEETNKRNDRWGGRSVRERTLFAREVVRSVRSAVGPDFPILLRISQWKTAFYDAKIAGTPDELQEWVGPLADAGVDIFDCSTRRFFEPEFGGSSLNLAGWVRKITGQPTITVGSVGLNTHLYQDFETGELSAPTPWTIREVARRLENEEFDLVAVGRSLLADPGWVRKVKARDFGALRPYSVELMKTLV
ncbi:NADH:flavin oxidoreductase [Arthrobacter mobilis]|uniref:NADH:flavin oxidoreductase n=1 Tax=Arthrobacter mobilis TaxID=2724944 RepID=A0A7X6K7R9_9MICC|nr:NADH:flavin oxidoreductase [Arthrobacter mobilis]NKX56684.1 NADH:flavin oxidoreductase [Arthrobacter mobilis]